MYELNRQQFGAFVARLRKEKGYTQKELAQQLHLSDKAVSKWETGVSIPDTALLVPLSELLGVTVTELLLCRRLSGGLRLLRCGCGGLLRLLRGGNRCLLCDSGCGKR